MTDLEKLTKGLVFLENIDKTLIVERGDECILISAPDNVDDTMINYLSSLGFRYRFNTFSFSL